MFPSLATLLPIAVLFAVATAAPDAPNPPPVPNCATANSYCCTQRFTEPVTFTRVLDDGTLVDTSIPDLSCNPAGSSCAVQLACCTGDKTVGQVNAVCNPVTPA